MKAKKSPAFVIIFFGEVMGYMRGRTVAGTATRYAADAGLDPGDADLQVIPWARCHLPILDQAKAKGEIKPTE